MAGAHRPTLDPAKAKEPTKTGILHSKALPSHTKVKYRKVQSNNDIEVLKQKLLDKETASRLAMDKLLDKVRDPETRAQLAIEASPRTIKDTTEDDSESEDDEEDLRSQLEAIKATQSKPSSLKAPVKRSWRQDSVFKKQSSSMSQQGQINDQLHSSSHKKFMKKYIH